MPPTSGEREKHLPVTSIADSKVVIISDGNTAQKRHDFPLVKSSVASSVSESREGLSTAATCFRSKVAIVSRFGLADSVEAVDIVRDGSSRERIEIGVLKVCSDPVENCRSVCSIPGAIIKVRTVLHRDSDPIALFVQDVYNTEQGCVVVCCPVLARLRRYQTPKIEHVPLTVVRGLTNLRRCTRGSIQAMKHHFYLF